MNTSLPFKPGCIHSNIMKMQLEKNDKLQVLHSCFILHLDTWSTWTTDNVFNPAASKFYYNFFYKLLKVTK